MKKTVRAEADDIDSSIETESVIIIATDRDSDREVENSSSSPLTSEEAACRIRTVTDPFTLQMARLCRILRELKRPI